MEVTTFVEMHADLTDQAGRGRIVRHRYLPEREIQTGIGPVAVRCPSRGQNLSGILRHRLILPTDFFEITRSCPVNNL